MSPKEYFHKKFLGHLDQFSRSLKKNGSCSRARGHQSGDLWGVSSNLLIPLFDSKDLYFSVGDLYVDPNKNFPDHLKSLSNNEVRNFLCALFYVVLFDQIMFTHFKENYIQFNSITRYPKMDMSIGFSRPLMMANPYEIFSEKILNSRNIELIEITNIFNLWTSFIVDDLDTFFANNIIGTIQWKNLKQVFLKDWECSKGRFGFLLLTRVLEKR